MESLERVEVKRAVGNVHCFYRADSRLVKSFASRSFYSFSTLTEPTGSNLSADMFVQKPCSGRQADETLGFSEMQITDIVGSDSLKALGQIRSEVKKKKGGNVYKLPSESRPNPVPPTESDEGGFVFPEKMLALAPFAESIATGTEIPRKKSSLFFLHGLQAEFFYGIEGAI